MKLPKWKDPKRKRLINISYKDDDYCKYYDIDLQDLTDLVVKLKNGIRLTDEENDRYRNLYTYTMSNCTCMS